MKHVAKSAHDSSRKIREDREACIDAANPITSRNTRPRIRHMYERGGYFRNVAIAVALASRSHRLCGFLEDRLELEQQVGQERRFAALRVNRQGPILQSRQKMQSETCGLL